MIPPRARAVLLDIEGTTTPLSFVADVLFPFARTHVAGFLARHAGDPGVEADVAVLRREHAAEGAGAPPLGDPVVPYVHWLMDQDRKSTGLKALQGRIWQEGYAAGTLRGSVYPDVRPALERWRARGLRVAIFSSGSVLAQKLIFGTTPAGDLTPLIDAFFDTTTGPKREAQSYRAIAQGLGVSPGEILFLSDVIAELDAAAEAGCATGLVAREGAPARSRHPTVTTFDGL